MFPNARVVKQAVGCRLVCTLLALFTVSGLSTCQSNNSGTSTRDTAIEAKVGDARITLPEDSFPTAVFTTKSAALVIKTGDTTHGDRFHRSLYSWEPGKQSKVIIGGHFLEVTRLSDDEFGATWYSENNEISPIEFVTLNPRELIAKPLILPKGGPTGWGGCQGDPRYVVCFGNIPTMTFNDKDYDEMGFTAILVIDVVQRKASWFPVKHQTYFHFIPTRRLIYVGDLINPTMNSLMKTFDLDGHERGTAMVWDVSLSPSGHFAESLQADGSESWEIYDVAQKKLLLGFNCDNPECKSGERDEKHHWNPVFDGQVVAQESGGAYGKGGTCDVYQSAPPRLVKRIPCDGSPVFDWSRDGRELITIQPKGGKFHRESVN
jgi:hypothetical protein